MDNKALFFSIVIPTYNRSLDLVRCLDSLVSQTYKNFEVIVCDNASVDNTKEVIAQYENILDLQHIYLDVNSGGPARPRNVGARQAKGDWICFLDSDDWFSSNKLEYISKLTLDDLDFIYHDLNIIQNGAMLRKMKSKNLSKKDAYHDLLYSTYGIPTSSVCVRKKIFNDSVGFAELSELVGLEDYHLWIELAKTGTRFKYIPLSLGNYFLGNENLSLNDDGRIVRYRFLFQKYIDAEKKRKSKKKISATLNYHIGWIYANKKKLDKSGSFLVHAFCYGSFAIKWGVIRIVLKNLFKK
ncbi:glycosyltransferase family 2 protein [Flavobacterium sp. NPDC079362]|uniref:glycosyltransferase family 2 protein n=1 Tax=Flavobacterium sp. NPDC079362 TaxID=3390566 RepID=UPI003D00B366